MSRLLCILFLSFCSLLVQAQRNPVGMDRENLIRFGVKGGLNLNKINGQSYKDGYNYNYQLGGFVQINFSNKFGLQPEVNFVQTTSEFSSDGTSIYDDLFLSGSQKKAKLNYLEIPLLLNINVGPSKRVKLQLGPSYGALLNQTVDSLKSNGNIFKNSEFSAIGGLFLQLPLVNLGARYKIGLTNINDIDNKEKWRNEAFQLFVGITF